MRYIMALLLSLILAVPALAGFEGPNASTGGFAGPGPQSLTKAAQVGNALDDTPCTLEGNILERLGKNKYIFQDDSGKITVEIDNKVFGRNTVTPETRVKLTGEVDHKKQGRANEVDVRYLEIVK
ncbi:NirD/YgiW/YdeI family stress tolerance protein [uncultured Bilophila sp.]|uniref:YgiW/YdeI family stress tolerance OB fold protein n=1 Tax=uncultured Bilophila sp. TaxID=529385 RepID=UPI00280B65A8|nr:NirD/YgiW/YdeI family stress tolerance protein [uncultured Bilophila sp.]